MDFDMLVLQVSHQGPGITNNMFRLRYSHLFVEKVNHWHTTLSLTCNLPMSFQTL
jgi:hypothetical protein